MTIQPKRDAMTRYGLSIIELQSTLATALGGTVASQLYEGDQRSDIVVRLPERLRTDTDSLTSFPVMLKNGDYVPLGEVAELELVTGYNQIYRENSKRRIVVTANVRGRDLGSFVKDVQKSSKNKLRYQPDTGLNTVAPMKNCNQQHNVYPL